MEQLSSVSVVSQCTAQHSDFVLSSGTVTICPLHLQKNTGPDRGRKTAAIRQKIKFRHHLFLNIRSGTVVDYV